MTDHDDDSRSFSARRDTAEPQSATSTTSTPSTQTPPASMAATEDSSTNRARPPAPSAPDTTSSAPSMRHQAINGARTHNASGSPSTANSPLSSRDPSPARPPQRSQSSAPAGQLPKAGLRSRKSSTDVSPSRGPGLAGTTSTVPSAAAIQRALSSASMPQLQPTAAPAAQDPSNPSNPSRVPRPVKTNSGTNSGDATPHWPISPRLKSPPPNSDARSRSRRNSLRTQQQQKKPEPPAIVVQSSSPAPASRIPVKDDAGNSDPDDQPISMKPSARGSSGNAPKLETVQEGSLPATPGFDDGGLDVQGTSSASHNSNKSSDEERNDATSSKVTEDLSSRASKPTESGSENTNNSNNNNNSTNKNRMQEQRSASTQRPAIPSKASHSSLTAVKSRTEAPSKNMTVETETVPSIAQSNIGNQDRSASGRVDSSLRLKPSNETIRPKKEKQKPKRKAPSIHSGTGRSPCAHISSHHHHPPWRDNCLCSSASSPLGSPVSCRSYDHRRTMIPSPSSAEMLGFSLPSTPFKHSYSSTNSSSRKASSKADVFEQKVASAVDEANSSDSDATFIYESNPPDQTPHRSRHHHSRTPSGTSLASLVDPRTLAMREQHKNPNKKTSMKFANPYNAQNLDMDGMDRGDGTIRVGSGRVSGGSHHHHIGRHGQGRGALSHVLHVDSDASMAQASRSRGASSRYGSQPNSPRFQTFSIGNGNGNGANGKKHGEYSAYDFDAEHAADDERTPLIPTQRSPRVRTPRRRNSGNLRHLERRHRRNGGWCRRFAGCLVLAILLLVLMFSAVGLIFATTKPLKNVTVQKIENVIATEQEIMLDLVVDAVNPNIIGVTVADLDMNIFAKSKYVGSDKWWREHGGHHDDEEHWLPPISDKKLVTAEDDPSVSSAGGVDEGTDPIQDPDSGEKRTMLLGRIDKFVSPLTFDGSYWNRHTVESLGELRLYNPGNLTEIGGPARWEEVLQHPFELIVSGFFKYQLPLSTHQHTVSVTATYAYDPDSKKKLVDIQASTTTTTTTDDDDQPVLLKSVKIPRRPLGRYARALLLG